PRMKNLESSTAEGVRFGAHRLMKFRKNSLEIVFEVPLRIMRAKSAHVTDPPDVITNTIVILVRPIHWTICDPLACGDSFEHRTVTEPASAHIVNLRSSRP